MDAAQARWRGTIPQGTELLSVEIAFRGTRTTIRKVVVESPERPPTELDVEGFVATGTFATPLQAQTAPASVTVTVDFVGEPPSPLRVTVNGGKVVEIPAWLPEDWPEEPSKDVLDRLWSLEREQVSVPVGFPPGAPFEGVEVAPPDVRAPLTEPRAVPVLSTPMSAEAKARATFAERLRAIGWDATLRHVFYNHDLETNALISSLEWLPAMQEVSNVLNQRIQHRVQFAAKCLWPKFDPLPAGVLLRSYAEKISEHFTGAFLALEALSYEDHFGPGGDPEPVDLFDWGFELFVTGRLVTRHNDIGWQEQLLTHGAPNGYMFLQYAECAIYCLESEIDVEFWKPKLRTLIRCAHIFLESAAPLIADPYPKAQTIFSFSADRYYPRSRRQELQLEYELSDLGFGKAWAEEFDDLRARFGAVLGTALLPSTTMIIVVPGGDILPRHHPTLKPQGIGTGKTFTCSSDVEVP